MIDARDVQGHFKAAIVVHVAEAGDLVVRYWTGEFDWILASDFGHRIAPLHSHSSETSVQMVDVTATSTLVTLEPLSAVPPAASAGDAGGAGEEYHGEGSGAKVQCSKCLRGDVEVFECSGSGSGSGTETPPLPANDDNVRTEAAHAELGTHLRRALQAHGITTPRVEAVLQVLRDEEVSSLAVWQALTPSELRSLLETHRDVLPVGLRTAMRLIHGAAPPM
jgi:hypothetical protein